MHIRDADCNSQNGARTDNYSSMYQDSQQQQTTEIDYINGYLCNEAKRLNISCPENQRVLAAIKTIEQSYAQ